LPGIRATHASSRSPRPRQHVVPAFRGAKGSVWKHRIEDWRACSTRGVAAAPRATHRALLGLVLTALTAASSLSEAFVGLFFLMTTWSQSWPPFMFMVRCWGQRRGDCCFRRGGGAGGDAAGRGGEERITARLSRLSMSLRCNELSPGGWPTAAALAAAAIDRGVRGRAPSGGRTRKGAPGKLGGAPARLCVRGSAAAAMGRRHCVGCRSYGVLLGCWAFVGAAA
jgi:hypothetical protein